MSKEVIAQFDSLCLMVIWILAHPEYSDCEKYPTKLVGTEYHIVRSK